MGGDYHDFRWSEVTCGRHFRLLPTSIVAVESEHGLEPSAWAELGSSAKAVLPVLLRHVNDYGLAFPGEGLLAAKAGLTRKTARKGARELDDRGLITILNRTSRRGRRCKAYRLKLEATDGIIMPSIFIDGGLWAQLAPAAKALAVAFRLFAKPRPDLDPSTEHTWLEGDEQREYLNEREYDFCGAEPSVLREFAGIGPRAYRGSLELLEENFFIEPDEERPDLWRVMVLPRKIKTPSYLNAKLENQDW